MGVIHVHVPTAVVFQDKLFVMGRGDVEIFDSVANIFSKPKNLRRSDLAVDSAFVVPSSIIMSHLNNQCAKN